MDEKMKKLPFMAIAVVAATMITGIVFAGSTTNKGANPNGKPFVEINGQIAEVISTIDAHQLEYEAIVARVEAIEDLDLQGQIDAINVEITNLQNTGLSLQTQVDDLGSLAIQNGADIVTLVERLDAIDDEILALQTTSGDNADAIAALEAEQLLIQGDIAANSAGLLAAMDDLETNYATIDLLNQRVGELQGEIVLKQDDIEGTCGSGSVSTVQDDGSLVCSFTNSAGDLTRYNVSYYRELDNYTINHTHYYSCGWWSSCSYNETHFYSGSTSVSVQCPVGYTVSGGGYSYNDGASDDIRVLGSQPSGNAWYVRFENRSSGNTYGHYGYAYANCLKNI